MVWVNDHSVPIPCMGRDNFHQTWSLQDPSKVALNTFRDGVSTSSQLFWAKSTNVKMFGRISDTILVLKGDLELPIKKQCDVVPEEQNSFGNVLMEQYQSGSADFSGDLSASRVKSCS